MSFFKYLWTALFAYFFIDAINDVHRIGWPGNWKEGIALGCDVFFVLIGLGWVIREWFLDIRREAKKPHNG